MAVAKGKEGAAENGQHSGHPLVEMIAHRPCPGMDAGLRPKGSAQWGSHPYIRGRPQRSCGGEDVEMLTEGMAHRPCSGTVAGLHLRGSEQWSGHPYIRDQRQCTCEGKDGEQLTDTGPHLRITYLNENPRLKDWGENKYE